EGLHALGEAIRPVRRPPRRVCTIRLLLAAGPRLLGAEVLELLVELAFLGVEIGELTLQLRECLGRLRGVGGVLRDALGARGQLSCALGEALGRVHSVVLVHPLLLFFLLSSRASCTSARFERTRARSA